MECGKGIGERVSGRMERLLRYLARGLGNSKKVGK